MELVALNIYFVDGSNLDSQGRSCEYSGSSVAYTAHEISTTSDREHVTASRKVQTATSLYEFLVFTGLRPEPFLTAEDVNEQCAKLFREHTGSAAPAAKPRDLAQIKRAPAGGGKSFVIWNSPAPAR